MSSKDGTTTAEEDERIEDRHDERRSHQMKLAHAM